MRVTYLHTVKSAAHVVVLILALLQQHENGVDKLHVELHMGGTTICSLAHSLLKATSD